jgi:hypothetical protein
MTKLSRMTCLDLVTYTVRPIYTSLKDCRAIGLFFYYFFINTDFIYVDLFYEKLTYRVKDSLFFSFQTFFWAVDTQNKANSGSWWQGLTCMEAF